MPSAFEHSRHPHGPDLTLSRIMNQPKLASLSSRALILSGVSIALWAAIHPWGTIAGPAVGVSGRWMLSHTFHFLAGLSGLVGLLGLLPRTIASSRVLETISYGMAFVGAALFTSTGLFTAFLWPVVARHAGPLTDANGPFFSPPHPTIVLANGVYLAGHMMLAITLARAGVLPWASATTLIAGAALLFIPPAPLSPAPWIIFLVAAALFGIGLASLGVAVSRIIISMRAAPLRGPV